MASLVSWVFVFLLYGGFIVFWICLCRSLETRAFGGECRAVLIFFSVYFIFSFFFSNSGTIPALICKILLAVSFLLVFRLFAPMGKPAPIGTTIAILGGASNFIAMLANGMKMPAPDGWVSGGSVFSGSYIAMSEASFRILGDWIIIEDSVAASIGDMLLMIGSIAGLIELSMRHHKAQTSEKLVTL